MAGKLLDEEGAKYMLSKIISLIKTATVGVYQYQGTKETYAEVLDLTGMEIGDVWNITNADPDNGIKAGDNVAWDGNKWDNFSGSLSFSTITNTEIDAMFDEAISSE